MSKNLEQRQAEMRAKHAPPTPTPSPAEPTTPKIKIDDETFTRADVATRARAAALLEARELARDYSKFFREAWKVLYPTTPLTESWHYDYIAEWLTYASSGQLKKDHPEWRGLIINVPPRTLKSTEVNICFPPFVWATHPEKKFMCISYGAELSVNEIATKRRKLVGDKWYTDRYPKVKIAEDVDLKHRQDTTAGGYVMATTPGGFAAGAGANIIIVDDIIKLDDAYSAARESANKYYENELYSRLNNQAEDFFIIVCQRLHDDDLPGHLLKNEPGQWHQVIIPLEAEKDEENIYPVSGKVHRRPKGNILLPERFPPHVIAGLKKSSTRWAGQYQQQPMPASGKLINPNWWQRYESDENGKPTSPLPQFELVVVSADCAFKGNQDSDYVALEKWGFLGSRAYLLELVNEQLDMVGTESALLTMISHGTKVDVCLIEDAANGSAIISRFKRMSLPCTVVPIGTEGGKLSRAMAAQPEVEAGNCYIPMNAPWLGGEEGFLRQLALGPLLAANDDMVDAWSQAVVWRKEHRYGFFEANLTFTPKGLSDKVTKPGMTEGTPKKPGMRVETEEQKVEARKQLFRQLTGRR